MQIISDISVFMFQPKPICPRINVILSALDNKRAISTLCKWQLHTARKYNVSALNYLHQKTHMTNEAWMLPDETKSISTQFSRICHRKPNNDFVLSGEVLEAENPYKSQLNNTRYLKVSASTYQLQFSTWPLVGPPCSNKNQSLQSCPHRKPQIHSILSLEVQS